MRACMRACVWVCAAAVRTIMSVVEEAFVLGTTRIVSF